MEGILKDYLLASDFDQTLSFNDSGLVLSELVGIPAREFERKTALLSAQNLVQQGGKLAYLLLHDPDYRSRVRISDLVQAGKQVRLKHHINHLSKFLGTPLETVVSIFTSFQLPLKRSLSLRLRMCCPRTTFMERNCNTTLRVTWSLLFALPLDMEKLPY